VLTLVTTVVLTGPVVAQAAANPSTGECLAASDASLQTNTLREERAQLLVCAARTCPTEVRQECASRLTEVTAKTPTVIFIVKDPSGVDLSAVKVTMDSLVLATRLDGKPLSVDPGEHNFTFEAQGQPRLTRKLSLQERVKDRREVVVLGAPDPGMTSAPPPAPQPSTAVPPASPSTFLPPSPDRSVLEPGPALDTQRVLALVSGGIGVVSLGVGTAFGVVAISKRNEARTACPGTACASETGVQDWSSANAAGNVATVGFILGGAGVLGSLALWFTARPSGPARAHVTLGLGSVQMTGTW